MNKELFDEIAKVAYELYERRGRIPGCHHDDWLEAEKIVFALHAEKANQEVKKSRAPRLKKTATGTETKKIRKAPAKTSEKSTGTKRKGTARKKEE